MKRANLTQLLKEQSKMMKNNYGDPFVTESATVKWSHLMKPDDKFGNPHHSVTVVVTPDIQKQIDSALSGLGGTKINGLKTDAESGETLVRFKNVLKAREGMTKFPILDSDDNETNTIPFATDRVRVKVTPALISRDNSVSLYMDKIQLVERNWEPSGESSSGGGMGKVDGGYVAEAMTTVTDEDNPF